MKTVYLHIGTLKTGSTSIQRYLSKNRKLLAHYGYCVPTSKLVGHHPLPISLIKEYSNFEAAWRKFEGSSEEIWETLVQEIEETACDNIIVSSEAFCDVLNESCRHASRKIGERIKTYLSPFKVITICYVREIWPYVKSMYGESIKVTARTISFEQETNNFINNNSIHIHPSIYLDFYGNLFGEDSLIVRKYDRNNLLNQDVVEDFLATIGLKDELKSLLQQHHKIDELNTSIKPEFIDLKRAFNSAGIQGLDFNKQISNMLIKSTSIETTNTTNLNPFVESGLVEIINAEQDQLNKRFGLDLQPVDPAKFAKDSAIRNGDYLFLVSLMAHNIKLNTEILAKLNGHQVFEPKPSRSLGSRISAKIRSLFR